jgi:2-oxopent-4-enoate/cis-2-oxohex-4-enoate hydratase
VDATKLQAYGDELYAALRSRSTVRPLSEREPDVTIDDAYRISRRLLERRLGDGEHLIGKKIGVTSHAVQRMLDVHQPDFGYLTDRMLYRDGTAMPISRELIQPRAEAEIAFLLKRGLSGPDVGIAEVLDATECVFACLEIVDSRIENWKIRITDTIADNASSGLFLLGTESALPRCLDLASCQAVVEKNGEVISRGDGSAALGSPAYCVAWLANTLSSFGTPLNAGEIILSGSLVPLEPVVPGDRMRVTISGIGKASVQFV